MNKIVVMALTSLFFFTGCSKTLISGSLPQSSQGSLSSSSPTSPNSPVSSSNPPPAINASVVMDGPAELPRVVPPSVYPDNCLYTGAKEVSPDSCGFNVVHIGDSGSPVTNGKNLQSAIDTPSCGPNGLIIALAPGVEYDGWWRLHYPGCNGHWIIIRSDISDNSLPRPGQRINSTYYLSAMPKLVGTESVPSIQTDPNMIPGHGPNHYWMMGLNVTTRYTDVSGPEALIQFGNQGATAPNQLPDSITVDRSWIHGESALANSFRGIIGDATNIVIMNNYISDIHFIGTDSQGLLFFTTPGPGLVDNNYIEGASEGIFFGGGDPSTKVITSDFTVTHNYLTKPLQYWPGSPTYNGFPAFAKNHIELKYGERILIEGNVFDFMWCCDTQQGGVLTLNEKDQYGKFTESTIQDVTFRYNWARHAQTAFGIVSVGTSNYANAFPASGMRRISLHDNLFTDISGHWSQTGLGTYADGNQYPLIHITSSQDPLNGLTDSVVVTHNTVYGSNAYTSFEGNNMTQHYPLTHFAFTNNIFFYGNAPGHGMGSGDSPEGCAALQETSSEVGAWDGNVLVGTPVTVQKDYISDCVLPGPRAPLLTTSTSGGSIPDNTTIYIRATYTIGSGESTASPELPKLGNWVSNFDYPKNACIEDSNFHEECSFDIGAGLSGLIMPIWPDLPIDVDFMTQDNGGYKGKGLGATGGYIDPGVTWYLHEPDGVLGTITTGKTGSNKNLVKVSLPVKDLGPETGWRIYASIAPSVEKLQNPVSISVLSSFTLSSLPTTTGVVVPASNTLPLAPPKWAGWPATWQAVGFENINANNFSLNSSSPLKGKGTRGSDPGANYDLVIQMTTPALP